MTVDSIILSRRSRGGLEVMVGFVGGQVVEVCHVGERSGAVGVIKVNVERSRGSSSSGNVQVVAVVENHVPKVGEGRMSER